MADAQSSGDREEYMLTTVDNPWDPFTQFDQWYAWDVRAGHNTAALLARLTFTSDDLSDLDQFIAIQDAVDEIARENVTGQLRKVKRGELASINSV